MSMTVEPMRGLVAHGSVYLSNPVLPDVSEHFEEGLREDFGHTFGDGTFAVREALVLPMPPFSFDDAVGGFGLAGILNGHNVQVYVSKPKDAGHHEFHYTLTVLD